jgi:hypothetical protein
MLQGLRTINRRFNRMKAMITSTLFLAVLMLAVSTAKAQSENYKFEAFAGYSYMN